MLMVACAQGSSQTVTEYLAEMLPMPVRGITDVLAGEIDLTLYNPEQQVIDWQQITAHQANALAAGLPALGGGLRSRIDLAHVEKAA